MTKYHNSIFRAANYLLCLLMGILLSGCGLFWPTPAPDTLIAPQPIVEIIPTRTVGPTPTPRPTPTPVPTRTATPVPPSSMPAADLFLDAEWYRKTLLDITDRWNSGLDGQSGMGAYASDFNGCFHVALQRDWTQQRSFTTTSIAQSRAIYINVEAYRVAGPAEGQRFLQAVEKGVSCLLSYFWDPEYGGFYWEIQLNGAVTNAEKQGYGNVHPLMVLAQAYSVTKNPEHLRAALHQLRVIEEQFLDPEYPGGIRPGFNRDFSTIIGVNNVDTFTHYFEALLALYDVTEGADHEHIAALIKTAADFLINHLAHEQAGFPDRWYVAYNYDLQWQPSQLPYTREGQWTGALHSTPGHCVELAYLLSRAVERGFDPAWLDAAEKFINFTTANAFDPATGGMLYEILDYDGQPLPGNPDNDKFIWWAQSESARMFLHFTVIHHKGYAQAFKNLEKLIHGPLTDPEYGGWYDWVQVGSLQPGGFDKGNIWKVNYHYTMFFVEVLRLAADYPTQVQALNQSYTP